jgi:hypothetical protein
MAWDAMASYLQARVRGRACKRGSEVWFGAGGGIQSKKSAAETKRAGSS